jgi:hypothetical protein
MGLLSMNSSVKEMEIIFGKEGVRKGERPGLKKPVRRG